MLGLLLAGLLVPQGAGAGVALRLTDPASGPLPEVRARGLPVRRTITLRWEIPGFVPGMVTFPTGGEGSRFFLGSIGLRKGRRLVVRAVSTRGEPVAGLEVILEREGKGPDASAPIREANRFEERTGASGFALFFLPPGESFRLRAPKIPGYAPLAPRLVPEGAAGIELALKSGPRIAGRVLDADGSPVPGARVRIAHGWDDGFPPPPEGFPLDHFQVHVVGGAPTGAAGRFSAVDPDPRAGPFFVAVETRDGLLFCSDWFRPGESVVVRLPRVSSGGMPLPRPGESPAAARRWYIAPQRETPPPEAPRAGPEGTLTVEWEGAGGPPPGFLIELRPRGASGGHLLPADGSASLFFPLEEGGRTRLEGIPPGLYDLHLHPLRALRWSSGLRIPRTRSAGRPSAAALRIAAGENPPVGIGLE